MKKVTAIAALALAFSTYTAIASGEKGTPRPETTITGECSILGKWQVVSVEAAGTTIDMKSEEMFMEFTADKVTSASKSTPAGTDKYERKGNTITVIDTKTGEKQAMEITGCTPDTLKLKMTVEGMEMVQIMKKA